MPKDLDNAVQELARAHANVVGDPKLQVFSFSTPEEIRLVEVSDSFLATGEVWPITFGADEEYPRSTVIQLTADEWARVLRTDPAMLLPSGWDLGNKLEIRH